MPECLPRLRVCGATAVGEDVTDLPLKWEASLTDRGSHVGVRWSRSYGLPPSISFSTALSKIFFSFFIADGARIIIASET